MIGKRKDRVVLRRGLHEHVLNVRDRNDNDVFDHQRRSRSHRPRTRQRSTLRQQTTKKINIDRHTLSTRGTDSRLLSFAISNNKTGEDE